MNWKLIIGGGLAYYIAAFIVSFVGATLIHEGVLDATYTATSSFWRPELIQDPPDMAARLEVRHRCMVASFEPDGRLVRCF